MGKRVNDEKDVIKTVSIQKSSVKWFLAGILGTSIIFVLVVISFLISQRDSSISADAISTKRVSQPIVQTAIRPTSTSTPFQTAESTLQETQYLQEVIPILDNYSDSIESLGNFFLKTEGNPDRFYNPNWQQTFSLHIDKLKNISLLLLNLENFPPSSLQLLDKSINNLANETLLYVNESNRAIEHNDLDLMISAFNRIFTMSFYHDEVLEILEE